MATSERDRAFENFVRSSREQFAKTSAYAIYKELERMKRDGVTLDNRFDWLETKLSNVLEQYAAILDDLAARYASLRVDKAPAETSSTGPKNIFRMPEIVTADWLPKGEILLVNPGVKCLATDADGKVSEYWEKNPSAVLVKNVGVPDGHSK